MSSIRDGIVVDGQCEDARWPYNNSIANPRPAVFGDIFRAAAGQSLAVDLDRIRNELVVGRALVLGLEINDNFLAGDPLPIQVGPAGEALSGRHAVLVVGYDDPSATLTIKNSWGAGWATTGYASLSYDYVTRHGIRVLSLEL